MNGKQILNWIIATTLISVLIGFVQLVGIMINEPFIILKMLVGLIIFTAVQYVILNYIENNHS